jgi:hypothetical protein
VGLERSCIDLGDADAFASSLRLSATPLSHTRRWLASASRAARATIASRSAPGLYPPGLSAAAGDTVRLLHQESNAYLCRPALPPTSVGLLPRGEGMASQVSPVPAQMWEGRAQSQRRRGPGEPSPGANVGGVSPSPSADVGGVSPVPAQMWQRSWLWG